jgi:hypothetical protein
MASADHRAHGGDHLPGGGVLHAREHGEADVTGAEVLGLRKRALRVLAEDGLLVERSLVDLPRQRDAVGALELLLEGRPVAPLLEDRDVLVVVAGAARGRRPSPAAAGGGAAR